MNSSPPLTKEYLSPKLLAVNPDCFSQLWCGWTSNKFRITYLWTA